MFARAESAMRKAGAKKIYVDTSSSDRYAGTRGFYQRMGFAEDARLPDFYGPGDSKVIYVKELGPESSQQRHSGETRDQESRLRNRGELSRRLQAGTASITESPELVACTFDSARLASASSRLELRQRAHPAAIDDHHMQVDHDGARIAGRGFREQALDDRELGTRRHGIAAAFQDGAGRHIVPMLEHALQHIEVSLDGNLGEEVAADEGYAIEHAMGLQKPIGADNGLGRSKRVPCMPGCALRIAASSPP